jgi:hypothetical protein
MDQPESRTRKIGYQTVTGTAKSGSDFVATSGAVAFAPGETSKTFAIDIVNDSTNEATERFGVRVKSVPATSCVAGGPDATVAIADDDPLPKPSPSREAEPVPSPKDPTGSSSGGTATGADPELSVVEDPASGTPTPSPTPATSTSSTASPEVSAAGSFGEGGGLSGFALAGIAIGAITIGSLALAGVRRRFLVTQPPS